MTVIGILLILLGAFGLLAGTMAFGDIGIACGLAGATALLSGIGLIIAARRMKKLE